MQAGCELLRKSFFLFFLVINIGAVSTFTAAAQSQPATEIPIEYQDCQERLWSYPANTLSKFVAQGHGAKTETGELEEIVKGLRCSDQQIIAYMEHHGLPYDTTLVSDEIYETGRGPFNRVLDFCIKNRGLFTRWYFGDCGGVTRFMMVDDRISHIISHAFK